MKKGHLLAEIDLFCRAYPLQRSRHSSHTRQPLKSQAEMMEALLPHEGLAIDVPMIIECECGYMRFKRLNKLLVTYDVDNLLKAILDNLQRMRVITNDRLVLGASCIKHESSSDHTHIKIYRAKEY